MSVAGVRGDERQEGEWRVWQGRAGSGLKTGSQFGAAARSSCRVQRTAIAAASASSLTTISTLAKSRSLCSQFPGAE
eukprot:11211582-Lingulodinium_polyedra.AAC.1